MPDFWDDPNRAQAILKEKSDAEAKLSEFSKAQTACDDAEAMLELAAETDDAEAMAEAQTSMEVLENAIASMELARMLDGPNDHAGAFIDINAGAGGTESMDWAAMLMRMYMH